MQSGKVKTIVRTSIMIIAVFTLVFLVSNERNSEPEQEPALESAKEETAPFTQDTAAPEDPAVNDQNHAEAAAGGHILGVTFTAQQDDPSDLLENGSGNAGSADSGSVRHQEEAPGEQSEEGIDETEATVDEQPYTMTNANNTVADGSKIAYITIDDGPSRSITPGILDILAQEDIKATFFVLPHDGVRDLYERIIDEGHEIGNHSYSHVYSKLYNSGDTEPFREDVLKARAYILDNFDYLTTTFRFPGGMMGRNSSVVAPRRQILEEIGYRYFDWNIDTGDANSRQTDKSASALTDNVLKNTLGRDRIIVLMHDTSDKRTTLEALPLIIAGLREQGYVFDILRNYEMPNQSTATPTSLASGELVISTDSDDSPASDSDDSPASDSDDSPASDSDDSPVSQS